MPVHNTANMETWRARLQAMHETNAEHAEHHAEVAAAALENTARQADDAERRQRLAGPSRG